MKQKNVSRRWIAAAGISGALAVSMGAFGAHGLRAVLPLQAMAIYETAVSYHFWHTLALLACGVLAALWPERERWLNWAGAGFLAGIVLFSGSLYGLALSDQRWLGLVTPVGGLCWIAVWLILAWAAFKGYSSTK